jgi:hypothetical protein
MHEVLNSRDQSGNFTHLSAADPAAIRQFLEDTLPDWSSVESGR